MVCCNNNKCDAIRVTLYLSVIELVAVFVLTVVFIVAAYTWPEITKDGIMFVITIVTIITLFVTHIMQICGAYYGNYCLLVLVLSLRVGGLICGAGSTILKIVSVILAWPLNW
jgi:hypothetical protein